MKLDKETIQARQREFPDVIRKLALHNRIVNLCISEYATGGFITKEEAWARMVELLTRDFEAEQRERLHVAMMTVPCPGPIQAHRYESHDLP